MAKVSSAEITHYLEQGLEGRDTGWSRSSRMIASYLRDNWHNLPYETGASIAAATGISEMTVIRFIRQIGFSNLKEFKDALKPAENATLGAVQDVLSRFQIQPLTTKTLEDSLELELEAITEAYKLTALPRWNLCTELLVKNHRVSVIGFQASMGLALDFSTRLQYVRPNVHYIQDHSGVFPEIFDHGKDDHCLVIVDTYAYSRKAILLAEKARELEIPMIIVTDRFTNWAYDYTDLVLQGSTYVKEFWDSPASLSVILNLLIGSVANSLGEAALARSEMLKDLGCHFDEFHRTNSKKTPSSSQ